MTFIVDTEQIMRNFAVMEEIVLKMHCAFQKVRTFIYSIGI